MEHLTIHTDIILKHSYELLASESFSIFTNKNVFFSSNLKINRNSAFQLLGNISSYGHDYDLSKETDFFIVSDADFEDLEKGIKSDAILQVETLRIATGNRSNFNKNLRFIKESFLQLYFKKRQEISFPRPFLKFTPPTYKEQLHSSSFTAIDFETATSNRQSACSIGFTRVEHGKIIYSGYYLIKPKNLKVSPINKNIHGISDAMLKDAPLLADIWHEIKPLIENKIVVAYNAAFDIDVLEQSILFHDIIESLEYNYICALKLAKHVYPDLQGYKLNNIADKFGFENSENHNAKEDAQLCAKITIELLKTPFPTQYSHDLTEKLRYPNSFGSGSSSPSVTNISLDYGRIAKNALDKSELITDLENADSNHLFYNKSVVFTGDLNTTTRQNAALMVTKNGGFVKSIINKKIDFVIVGTNPGPSKMQEIEKLQSEGCSIRIIREEEFLQYVSFE